MIAIATICMFG